MHSIHAPKKTIQLDTHAHVSVCVHMWTRFWHNSGFLGSDGCLIIHSQRRGATISTFLCIMVYHNKCRWPTASHYELPLSWHLLVCTNTHAHANVHVHTGTENQVLIMFTPYTCTCISQMYCTCTFLLLYIPRLGWDACFLCLDLIWTQPAKLPG